MGEGSLPDDLGRDVKREMRSSVTNRVIGGAVRLRAISPTAMIGFLAASALVPLLEPEQGMLAAGMGVLGSVGGNVLTDVVTAAIARLRPESKTARATEIEQTVIKQVAAAFASTGPDGQALRGEVIALFDAIDVAGTALRAAAAVDEPDLVPRMAAAFAQLAATFSEFAVVLVNARLDVQALHEDVRKEIARSSADRERARESEADLRRLLDVMRDLPSWRRSGRADSLSAGPRWDSCPYRGLLPFEERHATVFYGRRALTSSLVSRLSERLPRGGILLVIGASGAGKSSLLRAGLLAAVADDRLVP